MRNLIRSTVIGRATLTLTLLLGAGTAAAQEAAPEGEAKGVSDEAVEKAKEAAAAEGRKDGWTAGFNLGGTISFLHNSKVVGQENGATLQFGGVARAFGNFVWGDHEWQNSGSLEHLQTKTPSVEPFLKSADMLELKTLYLYRLPFLSWLGPYARASAFTPVFPGEGVRAGDVTLRRNFVNGNVTETPHPAQTAFSLTSWLEPLTLAESVGAFADPLKSDVFTASFKLGAGAQHVFARDGFVVADNADTPEIELMQLQTVHSAGAEAEADFKGTIIKDRLTWGALIGVYYPLLISVPVELDAVERTHMDVTGNVSFKLTEGLSLDYVLRARRAPFVLNDWQLQNSVLLTVGLTLL